MYVWLFQGNLGDGKTFGASVLAHYFAQRAKKFRCIVDLYSNYGLVGSKPMRHFSDFYEVAKSPNSICILDEAHVNLDSRLFARGSNIYMTQFFFYLRKLRSSLFMTSPHVRNLDSRIRQLTNILVDCHRRGGGFSYDIYDFAAEKLLRRLYMPAYVAKQIFRLRLYDSHAIVRQIEFPRNERDFDRFLDLVIKARYEAFKEDRQTEEDELLAELLEDMPDEIDDVQVTPARNVS